MKEKFINFKNSIVSSYRKLKDSIPKEVGKTIHKITKIILIFMIFILIPILFTTLSTLMGAGTISSVAYYSVFYTTWIIFFIDLIIMIFFNEYKKE